MYEVIIQYKFCIVANEIIVKYIDTCVAKAFNMIIAHNYEK